MSFFSFMSDMLDDVFAPACVHDSCSSGFIDMNTSSASVDSGMSNDSWTSAWGTQADFQGAAESGGTQFGGTFDAFDSSPSLSSFD